jgi:hypothetical protein
MTELQRDLCLPSSSNYLQLNIQPSLYIPTTVASVFIRDYQMTQPCQSSNRVRVAHCPATVRHSEVRERRPPAESPGTPQRLLWRRRPEAVGLVLRVEHVPHHLDVVVPAGLDVPVQVHHSSAPCTPFVNEKWWLVYIHILLLSVNLFLPETNAAPRFLRH